MSRVLSTHATARKHNSRQSREQFVDKGLHNITHNQRKYIVETKIWRGDTRYQAGKKQLAAYLKLENVQEGYYVVLITGKNRNPA